MALRRAGALVASAAAARSAAVPRVAAPLVRRATVAPARRSLHAGSIVSAWDAGGARGGGSDRDDEVATRAQGTLGPWLRIIMTKNPDAPHVKHGMKNVKVTLPLGLVNLGLKMGKSFAPKEFRDVDLEEVKALLDGLNAAELEKLGIAGGKLVHVESEEGTVEVFVQKDFFAQK
mmetsp:Transcript_133/g.459  ORF Transcript_133/g.459 Transcript_133/m.459 type:complete len:175 (+) Transcript_133:204-728(+)